jgi:putative PIN family toxin of toxin-antitoxin system
MRRPHIVLDTNVLVSALLFGGPPREILDMIIAGAVTCSLSLPILDELKDVLQRPKFGFSSQQALAVVEELSALGAIVDPAGSISVIRADPNDDRILECALEARADVIVSGDAHLLELGRHEAIRVLSPSEFLGMMREGPPGSRGRRRRKRRA